MRPPELLFDMLASAPTSDAAREARWAAAVAAVAHACPELADAGGAAFEDARALRIAFGALDVLLFHGSFTALFELGSRPVWGWSLDDGDAPCDAWIEADRIEGSDDLGNGWCCDPDVSVVFVVHRRRLAAAFPDGTRGPARFDDHVAGSALEAVVGTLGRRMIRQAARHATSGPEEIDPAERVLLAAFGDGPRVPEGARSSAPRPPPPCPGIVAAPAPNPVPTPTPPPDDRATILHELEELRPEGAQGPVPDWLPRLFREVTADLDVVVASARAAPADACRWLAALLLDEAISLEDSVGGGYAPVHAAAVLGLMGKYGAGSVTEEAIDALVDALERSRANEVLHGAALYALADVGPPALEVLLAAHASTAKGADARISLTEALALLQVHDPRVRDAILELLERDAALGATLAATHADPALLPAVRERWDAIDAEAASADPAAARDALELADAIRELGGAFTEAEETKLAALRRAGGLRDEGPSAVDALAEDLRDLLEEARGFAPPAGDAPPPLEAALAAHGGDDGGDDLPTEPLERDAAPGRNDSCWCGSGAKYKKCHLDADARGDAPAR